MIKLKINWNSDSNSLEMRIRKQEITVLLLPHRCLDTWLSNVTNEILSRYCANILRRSLQYWNIITHRLELKLYILVSFMFWKMKPIFRKFLPFKKRKRAYFSHIYTIWFYFFFYVGDPLILICLVKHRVN